MTLVFDSLKEDGVDHRVNDCTHALIVGVGAYAMRVDKARSPAAPPVAAAARSAFAVAWWLMRNRRKLSAPLGTIEMLVSDPDSGQAGAEFRRPDGRIEAVKPPTIPALTTAVDDWYKRLDSRPGNTALFFAAGHGVYDDQPYLLTEDHGASPLKAFDKMVALQDFYRGMATCQAGRQLFVIDCCQEVNKDLLAQLNGPKGEEFISIQGDQIRPSERAVIYSTTMGVLAGADETGMSHFTKAFLRGLDGEAARRGLDRTWHVSYQSLYDAIPEISRRTTGKVLKLKGDLELSGLLPIVSLDGPPTIELEIATDPSHALCQADLVVKGRDGVECFKDSRPTAASLRLSCPAVGGYRADASFVEDGPFSPGFEYFDAEPLMYPVKILIAERTSGGGGA